MRSLPTLLFALCATACSTPPATPLSRFSAPLGDAVVPADVRYRVAAPDLLVLRAPGVRQLDKLLARVAPDGRISAGPLGDCPAAGRTPAAIAADLTARLRALAPDTALPKNATVDVAVLEYASQSFHVAAPDAPDPGRKPFTGADTVISALIDAGYGHDTPPWPRHVALSRAPRDGRAAATAIVDVRHMLRTGDLRENYLLEPGDVVEVPPDRAPASDKPTD
ncbi:MAG TPA: polysaccharide biosynthesis/export family protein [Tepidisphaeraceae bacterium]|nr:polysaccharide biosynthesis/export family protein [Tepidisphaeraceae bacterium]